MSSHKENLNEQKHEKNSILNRLKYFSKYILKQQC